MRPAFEAIIGTSVYPPNGCAGRPETPTPLRRASLPLSYSMALDNLEIGATVGSCGAAAFLGKAVIVDDIEHDPRWGD